MEPDIELERRILEALRDANPKPLNAHDFPDVDRTLWEVTTKYLVDHELVAANVTMRPTRTLVLNARITEHGLDHLRADGGLTAELGVVTIRLEADQLKQLIAERVASADLDPADKRRWLAALQSLPAATTKHLVLKLMDAGLKHAPDALRTIQTWLGL